MHSEIEKRIEQISRQLEHARLQLALKSGTRYANEGTYKYQRRRAAQLITALEEELSMLSCPGEYDELAVATVADELGLTWKQVRSLIKSGEIDATGNAAHERVSRSEMERIAALGAAELLRLSQQESAEIFEEAVPRLQAGDLEFSERSYRRLEGRGAWGEAYTLAFLLCLEIAKGEFENALDTVRVIRECTDHFERAATMTRVRKLLTGLRLDGDNSQEFRQLLLASM
jgi:hypothetical protein